MSALETLNLARAARGEGDVDRCVMLSAAALQDATDEGDGETAWNAAIAPGRAYLNRGEANEALGYFRWALDVAGRMGLTYRLANSYHWLSLASREAGNDDACRRLAGTALELYHMNPRDRHMANLVADLALADFERYPSAENAAYCVQTFRAAPVSVPTPINRLFSAANVMLTAATLGVRCRYRDAAEALESTFAVLPDHEGVAQALVQGAKGAAAALDYPLSATLCERAELIAETRGELRMLEMAREVKESALAEKATPE